ncbi:protein aurora borealis-like [Mytilus californianus]|uniref:protein aurora borealis-like n=1 Tax=Mytilus californianus TaxID=6549 RepID=UPI0022465F87|nr:protein aurora borealis-like [Mytilus californianus]
MDSDVSSPVKPIQTPSKGLNNIEMMCSPIACARSRTPGSSTKKLGHPLMMSSPSPAHKLPGSSTRNELYLKSVLSPYHKNYTPLSATPTGFTPMYRTPGRNIGSSPIVKETPETAKQHHFVTPQRLGPKNPFEFDVEHLEGNMFMSPGVFSLPGSTPASDEKKAFRWSIEHLAVLHPADIDEMPHQQDPHHGHDRETEEKAQRAIDTFFSNNLVAPSPATGLKATPNPGQRLGCLPEELQGSIKKQLPGTIQADNKKEASCQTMLSLPVDFDINKVLGQFLQNQQGPDDNPEMLSTSSLRRKLFFQGDNSGVAISPVKGFLGKDESRLAGGCASPVILSSKTPQKTENHATPLKTPSRNQFSSSPIKNVRDLHTPLYKRTPGENFLDNLDFSPIVHGHLSRVRSSGLFNPHNGSFVEDECSPIKDEHLARPLESPEISPIKPAVLLKTPSISSSAIKPSFHSPGVSPIALASPVLSPPHDGSFIQTHECCPEDSDEDMKTPLPAEVNEDKLKKAESCRKVSTLGRHRQRNIFPEFDDTAMDFEPVPIHKNLRFADVDDIKTSSLLVNRDMSFGDMELTSENAIQPNSTSQDTGYQTTSLQMTSQDTASGSASSLTNHFPVNSTGISNSDVVYYGRPSTVFSDIQHTNLTAQFSSLPTNSFYYEGDSVLDCNDHPMSSPKENLVHHILDITNPEKFGHAPYSEEEIIDRARKVLQLANEMYPESNQSNEREVQDICDKTGLSTLHELETIVSPEKGIHVPFKSASDQAMEILRRAGEDLAKFGHLLSSIKASAEKSILNL